MKIKSTIRLLIPIIVLAASGYACNSLYLEKNSKLAGKDKSLYVGYGTYFDGFGYPYGGCGVPEDFYQDDSGTRLPFIALNTQNTGISDPGLEPPITDERIGHFADGRNCGRWIRFWPKENCPDGQQEAEDGKICIRHEAVAEAKARAAAAGRTGEKDYLDFLGPDDHGPARYQADALTVTDKQNAKPMYGIIADSCQDPNFWCRTDHNHLDIATFYVQELVEQGLWNNRRVEWEFIDQAPEEYTLQDLRFAWGEKAQRGLYLPLIVYNTQNGVSKIEVNGVEARVNGRLGQQFVIPHELSQSASFQVEVFDHSGKSYGLYAVEFPASCQSSCEVVTRVPSSRISP